MRTKKMIGSVAGVIVASVLAGTASAAEAPKRSPELQALNHFVGTWDVERTVTPKGKDPVESKGVSHRTWSKGGKFLLFDDPSGEVESHLLLTYDPESKTYRGVFMNGLDNNAVTATWDEKKKSMYFVIKMKDKSTYTGSHRFPSDGVAEVSGKVTSAAGQEVVKISFKQTRRKE